MLIDGFRSIKTNTQTRHLPVLTAIVQVLNDSLLPKPILANKMYDWSREQETNSVFYSQASGKLTQLAKPTQAFMGYLQLAENLQLVAKDGEAIRNSRYGILYKNDLYSKLIIKIK